MRRLLTIAILAMSALSAAAQNHPFAAGEQLDFKLQLKVGLGIELGNASFRLDNAGEDYHLSMKLVSNSFVSTLYRLDHVYDSYFSRKDLGPDRFTREAREGASYWVKNDFRFYDGGRRLHSRVEKSTRPPVDTVLTFDSPVRDLVSVFYIIRTIDMNRLTKEGARYKVVLDRNVMSISIKAVCREVKKISGIGKFNTVKVVISLPGDKAIYCWLSDDASHVPLYFSAPVSFGTINGRCTAYKGLKYKLSSRIN